MTIEETELLVNSLERKLNIFSKSIGKILIGNNKQFPYGWRKANKGRTVWRIVEEIVIQNLQANNIDFGVSNIEFASETSIYDFKCQIDNQTVYVNIKTAVLGEKKAAPDDISKSDGIKQFFQEDKERQLFIAKCFIKFNEVPEMSIEIDKISVFPATWIPIVYINPANNNIQYYTTKLLNSLVRRTTDTFLTLVEEEIVNVREKKLKKNKKA